MCHFLVVPMCSMLQAHFRAELAFEDASSSGMDIWNSSTNRVKAFVIRESNLIKTQSDRVCNITHLSLGIIWDYQMLSHLTVSS